MTRSKDEGACASCRKEIPLVPDDQGDLVLRTHHVVAEEYGYDIAECPGSRTAPADLDDSKDWAWVPARPEVPVEGVPFAEAVSRATEPMRALGEALDGATMAMSGSVTLAQHSDPPGVLLADIASAVRQAYADATGGPLEGVVTVELEAGAYEAQVLGVGLVHGGEPLHITVPFNPCLRYTTALRERLGREAGHRLRYALRTRTGVCPVSNWPHRCYLRGAHSTHRCGVPTCRATWPNPEVTDGTS